MICINTIIVLYGFTRFDLWMFAGKDDLVMKALKKTATELLILGVAGLLIAFTANGVRAKNSIKINKNYFDIGLSIETPTDSASVDANVTSNTYTLKDENDPIQSAHPKHPYQEMTYDEVFELLNDPNTALGLNVFVDARNDEHYNEGHIPGALQCDPYNVGLYIDNIIDYVTGAEKVVVYCGGGECEDSIFMCRELVEMDVPMEAIYLFVGGWKEWSDNGSPIETGSNEE